MSEPKRMDGLDFASILGDIRQDTAQQGDYVAKLWFEARRARTSEAALTAENKTLRDLVAELEAEIEEGVLVECWDSWLKHYDSCAIRERADVLRRLAGQGRLRIVVDEGRRVIAVKIEPKEGE